MPKPSSKNDDFTQIYWQNYQTSQQKDSQVVKKIKKNCRPNLGVDTHIVQDGAINNS